MKKFFGILAIAATVVACDNTASSEQRTKDSTDSANKADSIARSMPTTPTVSPMDTMSKMMDTSSKMMDTTNKMSQ